MIIRCIAVDDEPLAVKKISGYIQKTPFLELVAECRSAFEAMEYLDKNDIDLIFLDINMPNLNGMEFVKSLINQPHIVFTTAYSDYAVEGFKVDAVDYILKPISYSAFLKAAQKVKKLIELETNESRNESIKITKEHLFVKSDYKIVRIELNDIKYIESDHAYIKIHLVNSKPVMTLISLKNVEEQLPPEKFMRVHRSFIVNLNKISVIERERIIFDGNVYIPISEQYKNKFQEYLEKNILN